MWPIREQTPWQWQASWQRETRGVGTAGLPETAWGEEKLISFSTQHGSSIHKETLAPGRHFPIKGRRWKAQWQVTVAGFGVAGLQGSPIRTSTGQQAQGLFVPGVLFQYNRDEGGEWPKIAIEQKWWQQPQGHNLNAYKCSRFAKVIGQNRNLNSLVLKAHPCS